MSTVQISDLKHDDHVTVHLTDGFTTATGYVGRHTDTETVEVRMPYIIGSTRYPAASVARVTRIEAGDEVEVVTVGVKGRVVGLVAASDGLVQQYQVRHRNGSTGTYDVHSVVAL